MPSSSSSWESATLDELRLTATQRRERHSSSLAKLKILHKLLLVIESLRVTRSCLRVDERLNEYERHSAVLRGRGVECVYPGMYPGLRGRQIEGIVLPFDRLIADFLSLNLNGVPCRIYFVLGRSSPIEAFLECILNNTVVKHKGAVNGLCFSVDFTGKITDQTVAFSACSAHHHFYTRVLHQLTSKLRGGSESENLPPSQSNTLFDRIDRERLQGIPQSLQKMKIHPQYVLEEFCRYNETIYPKRPVFGYFKGKPVYSRGNVMKLRTEGGWHTQGREVGKGARPYRIHREKKLYAEFQTSPVSVEGLTGPVMNAFHPNFTPKTCAYVDYSPDIAGALGLDHAECVVGFRGKELIRRGFFIEKRHCFAVNRLIEEKRHFEGVAAEAGRMKESVREWRRFITRVKKREEIMRRIS